MHFTDELLEKLKKKGIKIANVTLHVGIGTFRPVKVENIEEHYGKKWPDDWTLSLIGQLEAKSAKDLAYTIKTLGLAGAYYPSSDSPESDDHSIDWPEKPEDLYVGLTGTNPPIDYNNDNNDKQGALINDLYI